MEAQQQRSYTATVVDETNQSIPFASVRLIKYGQGVITNADGGFRIPVLDVFLRDTLVITCIGFKSRRLAIASLDPLNPNIIRLQSSVVELSPVEIRAADTRKLTGRRLVERAINRIPYNYPQSQFGYIAYYRDYQIKDRQYVNMNEALVQVNDEGFSTNDQLDTKIQLIEYKPNTAFPVDTIARQPYDNIERKFIPHASLKNFSGNELATLMVHDPLRNHGLFSFSFINRLDKDFLINHRFSMAGTLVEDNRVLYIVSFITTDNASGMEHQGRGKLFIEKGNYRIHKLQYSTIEWQSHKPVPLYNVSVEYVNRGNLMYLNYISFNNEFKMRNEDDFKVLEVRQLADSAGFLVRFSHRPTEHTARNEANYNFRLNGKRIDLRKIVFTENRSTEPAFHMAVMAYVKDTIRFNEQLGNLAHHTITADIKGIRDFKDREVNVMTFVGATQYREIFVQQHITDPSDSTKYPVIDKYTPLYKTPPPKESAHSNFWMNTPLIRRLEDADGISN